MEKDDREAAAWYRKAADQGDPDSQETLAEMYHDGRGVEQSEIDAVAWYQKAAELGNVIAQNNLGAAYDSGSGVSRDFKKAAYWYTKAAEHGNAMAQNSLAQMYAEGQGVAQDDDAARLWFGKAAAQGLPDAQRNLQLFNQGHRSPPRPGSASARVFEIRAKKSFKSFGDAEQFLGPILEDQTGDITPFAQSPMAYKGRVIKLGMIVIQVVGDGQLLLQSLPEFPPDSGMKNALCMGTISKQFLASPDIVDDQMLIVIGEITGTASYTTALGAMKTVPRMTLYAVALVDQFGQVQQ